MADFLIKHLKKKEEEHSALGMLVNQWGFDEKLIPKALQSVGNLFPHYSRHDESHSRQILINIERLLGEENISKLTATDTWLLLESAYWHDIGMVVPQQDIVNALEDKDFQLYVDEILNNPNHDLYSFCLTFNFQDTLHCFNGISSPIDIVDKFRQLMAEWFRRQHAGRANQTVQAPWKNAGISSPRTELIPARLFKLLGRICYMHGLAFDDLLAPEGLPYRESGLAHEDCHPRFIACLLRMGDLLDLDDNRFCPVMQGVAGKNRPALSKAHEDKHAGMRHLRIDRERIEISAECSTVDGYLETFKWFDWLKQEMQNQMAHWQDIVPAREFGLLPTLGDIVVTLRGKQKILKEGQRPQFSIDGEQAIKLLQGNNLYESKFSCVRELLQNAVDASLLKLWLTKKDTIPKWKSPFSSDVQEILKGSAVKITLLESASPESTPNDKAYWTLSITDNGTGISRDDLAYMLKIGGSQKNSFRQEKIKSMPEWMKPSGAFGIGFQSVFMICDVVKLTTKSIFTNEILEITMHSPTGDKEGLVLIKPLENDISLPYGTRLEISFLLKKFSYSYSIGGKNTEHLFINHILRNHDPILDDDLPTEAAQLADKIQIFTENSMLRVHGELAFLKAQPSFPLGSTQLESRQHREWRYIKIEEQELALKYQIGNKIPAPQNRQRETLYRGQPFIANAFHFSFVVVQVNLLSGKAGKWLTADREKLTSSATKEFSELVIAALEKLVQEDIASSRFSTPELKPHFSLFLEEMALYYGENWKALAKQLNGEWVKLEIAQFGKSEKKKAKTFKDFLNKKSWTFAIEPHSHQPSIPSCDLVLKNTTGNLIQEILFTEWLSKNNTIQIIEHKEEGRHHKLKNKSQPLFDNETLATHLMSKYNLSDLNYRLFWSYQQKTWDKLHLKNGTKLHALPLLEISPEGSHSILLPFLFYTSSHSNPFKVEATPKQLDALCKWVKPHLVAPSVSLSEIREAYDDLINYIDNNIMAKSPYKDDWGKARSID